MPGAGPRPLVSVMPQDRFPHHPAGDTHGSQVRESDTRLSAQEVDDLFRTLVEPSLAEALG